MKKNYLNRRVCKAFCLIIICCTLPLKTIAQDYTSGSSVLRAFSVKTNLLYDAAMIPNLGFEFAFPTHWSLSGSWNYAWWSNYNKHRFWRTYGGELEARKWFGRYAQEEDVLKGQHSGLFLMAGTYDFEHGHTGYMNDLYFGIGVSYGYALPLTKNLSLDFVIGVGYLCGTYQKYRPQNNGYCIIDSKNLSYFGPIKAEISLVWTIDRFINKKRGGIK